MLADKLVSTYDKLDENSRHILQILAVSDDSLKRDDLVTLSNRSGWTNSKGKQLSKTEAAERIEKLIRKDLLVNRSCSSVQINRLVQDLAIQDSVRGQWFNMLSDLVEQQGSNAYYRPDRSARNLRIAFLPWGRATIPGPAAWEAAGSEY